MVCSFFGHKDAPQSLYPKIKEYTEILIAKHHVINFMVGNQGSFDRMALKALRELKQIYPHICYNVVLAYMPAQKQEFALYDPSETFLPEGIETVPKRFAISWRNKWMVRQSDMVLGYVTHSWGGAAQFLEYAQQQGKKVMNLSEGLQPPE